METWDLYDSEKRLTGRTMARGSSLPEGLYHLVVSACLFDAEGRLLCQKRNLDKESFPGYWEFSAGGSALAGETSREAVTREVKEELGLDIPFSRPSLTVSTVHAYHDYYIRTVDADHVSLRLQKEEVADAAWLEKETVLDMVEKGTFLPLQDGFIDFLFAMHRKPSVYRKGDA
jgi:isopentenyldiphosphate isomerase